MRKSERFSGVCAAAGGVALGLILCAQSAEASTIVLPADKTSADLIADCRIGGAEFKDCTSRAFVQNSLIPASMTSPFIKGNFNGNAPTTQNFQSAFNTWKDDFQKSDLNTGVDWSIKNGGVLPDLTLTVNPFSAIANVDGTGGISDITISLAVDPGYKGPSLNQLVWSQGLYINYSVPSGSRLDPPANTLDSYLFNSNGSLSGGSGPFGQAPAPLPTPPANSNDVTLDIGANPADTAWADPIYPFQTADKSFFDAPQGLWPDASFRGIALLSTVSETTNAMGKVTAGTLTVYDGVSYGFDLSVVPEPDTWLMLIVGFGSVGLSALRRRSAHRRLRPTFASA